jgi:hypothetical protein
MAKRHGQEFWRQHLEAWRCSDLTQREYCAHHGLGEKAFYRWRRKEREAAASAKTSLTLVPAKTSLTLVPAKVGAPVAGGVVQLHSPGGWRIELPAEGVPWLADLLRQLP